MLHRVSILSWGCQVACGASLLAASTSLAYTRTPTFGNTPTATPTSNRPIPVPVVHVFPNPVTAGHTVTLDASRSTGSIFSYQWSSPAEIVIDNASSWIASFVAPDVTEPTEIPIDLKLTSYGGTPGNFAHLKVEVLPPDTIELLVGHIRGLPGTVNSVDVTLRTVEREVVDVRNEIAFDRFATIVATKEGLPDCSANPELAIETERFVFLPEGCTPDVDCVAVSAHVIAATPIPDDAVVYSCQIYLSTDPIDPVDTCRHELRCEGTGATTASQEPLDVACKEGSATADISEVPVSFEVSVEPPQPRVGETVRIRVSTSGRGGNLSYRLFGTEPFLEGDIGPFSRPGFGTIEYELQAVCPGTATLRSSLFYETEIGCPGSDTAFEEGEGSDSFAVEILPATTYSITGTVAEFPSPGGCFGAQRGATVTLQPLGLMTETDLSIGGFTFENVPAGEYTLTVGPSCNPFGCWPTTMVTVTDSDVNVQICPIAATPTATPTVTPTPVASAVTCPGDCDDDAVVKIDEVVGAIRAAVEDAQPRCGVDVNFDGRVDINELVLVVRAALVGCFGAR